MQDLMDPLPGGIIRLKPAMYGQPIKDVISQLGVTDVTRTHLTDSVAVTQLLQRLTGMSGAVRGDTQQGGRKTATEIRSATGFSVSRLKTLAEFQSACAFAPLSQMLVQSSQQHYDQEQTFRVVGNLMDPQAGPFVQVRPQDIAGFYDFVPVDGTMPVDRFAQVALWKDILTGMAGIPQVLMQYDLGRIFGWMAKLGGLRNLEQFKVKISSDEAIMMAQQQGNVVPLGGGRAEPNRPEIAAGGAGPGGGGEIPARVSRPSQTPQLGPSL
jgi:hypothetical protein